MSKEYNNTMDFIKTSYVIDGGFISKYGNLIGGNKGKLRYRINNTLLTLSRVMFYYHYGIFPTKIKYRDGNERNINIENLSTCEWIERKISMSRKMSAGNRYADGGLNRCLYNGPWKEHTYSEVDKTEVYENKEFSEIFIGSTFAFGGKIWKKEVTVNFLTNAISTDGDKEDFKDELMVIDLESTTVKETTKVSMRKPVTYDAYFTHLDIGEKFSWGMLDYKKLNDKIDRNNAIRLYDSIKTCIKPMTKIQVIVPEDKDWEAKASKYGKDIVLTTFKKTKVGEQFSSHSTTYTKTSLTRLEDGSNAVRLDGSTAFIADNRKVEIYR